MKSLSNNSCLSLYLSLSAYICYVCVCGHIWICLFFINIQLQILLFFLLTFLRGTLCRTESGTFMDGDLLVNRDGVRIVSQSEIETVR